MSKKKHPYYRTPDSYAHTMDMIHDLEQDGHISSKLADVLYVLLSRQIRVDYDAIADAYRQGDDKVKNVIERVGGVVTLNPEQVKLIKYGS